MVVLWRLHVIRRHQHTNTDAVRRVDGGAPRGVCRCAECQPYSCFKLECPQLVRRLVVRKFHVRQCGK